PRLVRWERVRALHLPRRPDPRPVRGPLLDHDRLQRPDAAAPLVAEAPAQPDRPLPRLARDPGGDVARTLHHHRRLAEPRLPPVELAPVRADLGRLGPPPRQPRPLPPPLPPLPPVRAVHPGQRGQAPAARTRPGGFAVMSRDDPT